MKLKVNHGAITFNLTDERQNLRLEEYIIVPIVDELRVVGEAGRFLDW